MSAPPMATPGGYDVYQFIGGQRDDQGSSEVISPQDAGHTTRAIVDDTPGAHSERGQGQHIPAQLDDVVHPTSSSSHAPNQPTNVPGLDLDVNHDQGRQESSHRHVLENDLDRMPRAEDKAMYPEHTNLPPRTSSIPLNQGKQLPPRPAQTRTENEDDSEQAVYGTSVGSSNNKVDESSPSVQRRINDAGHDPKPDLVVVFALPNKDAPSSEWSDAEQEYARLKKALKAAGMKTAARAGGKDRNERLVLVKALTSMVQARAQQEKLEDWLNAVKGSASRPNPHQPRDFKRMAINPSERVRHVGRAVDEALHSTTEDNPFPRVTAYFPPHDPEFNTQWLKNWSSANLVIPEEELVQIKNQFGESVALYFEFLRYYFVALAFPSFIGLSTWLGGYHFSKLYSVLLVAWSVVFLEGWKFRERQIAVRWGSYGTSKHGRIRLGFKPEETVQSAVTGEQIPYSPWYKRELRIAATVPALFGFAAILALLITCIFCGEVIISEVYNGPGKQFLSLVPTVFFASVVPQVVGLWYKTAKELTEWENHPTEVGHERSLTLKMFALNAIVSYGALTLTSYLYLPFASFVVPYLTSLVRGSISTSRVSTSSLASPTSFTASSHRLTNTLFALMTTTQAIGAFTEVALPFIQRKIAEYRNAPSESSSTDSQKATKPKDRNEQNWLERIRAEVELPTYDLFSDYAEMVIQFGHVTLWSTAWPLAPLAAFINNFVELRGDAFKLCVNSRRPVPQRTDSLGPWVEALGWITYLSALTNASLVYLLRPMHRHVEYATTKALSTKVADEGVAAVLNSTLGSNPNPFYASTRIGETEGNLPQIRGILLGALLCALASEHAFLLLRYAVAHLMDMLVWKGSDEELRLRRSDWLLKRDYVESRGIQEFESEIENLEKSRDKEIGSLGRRDENAMAGEEDIWSEEDKGVREETNRKSQ